MNPRPLYARLAAEVLAEGRHDGESAVPISDEERARAIAIVSAAIAQREKRQKRARGAFVVLSLAASVLLVFGVARALSRSPASSGAGGASGEQAHAAPSADPIATPLVGDVRVQSGEAVHSIAQGTPLAAGDHVLADSSARASVTLVTGTRLALEGTSDLAMTQADRALTIFTLMQGAVRADVAKLKAGERFLVRTADTEVEVRGTSFRVAVVAADASCSGAGAGATTRVEVTEGVVAVRNGGSEIALHPGESWPPPCVKTGDVGSSPSSSPALPSPSVAAVAPAPTENPAAPLAKLAASPVAAPHAAARPAPRNAVAPRERNVVRDNAAAEREQVGSDLAAQNDLFARAMQEKQGGRPGTAVATLERFAATYPASPLAESASAERMKILATSEPARARTAARDYLARYPRGFARGDAEKILATSP